MKKIGIGIIGHAEDKFTDASKKEAIGYINHILDSFPSNGVLISGHCPLGGIDIWAEELAIKKSIPIDIKSPKQFKWDAEYGFKQRNIDIARESKSLWVILVDTYPLSYIGKKFSSCYHCKTNTHVKSGACWTAKVAKEWFDNAVNQIIIKQKEI